MAWLFHWQSAQIKGYFDKLDGGRWAICVNKSPVPPELLAGRKITLKSEGQEKQRRLGRYLHSIATVAYFDVWPGKDNEDFYPPEQLRNLLSRYKTEPRPEIERDLRQRLKTEGARERVRLGVTDWPICIFERYAMEPLENLILAMAAAGLCAQPINQFHESRIDGMQLVHSFLKDHEFKRRPA